MLSTKATPGGRNSTAQALYRRALFIEEESFGPDHPWVATHLNNLASLLKAIGSWSEAEQLYRRALEIDERSYGWDHPTIGSDLNNLAALLEATDRLEEAEQLTQLVLRIFLRQSVAAGHQHPSAETVIYWISSCRMEAIIVPIPMADQLRTGCDCLLEAVDAAISVWGPARVGLHLNPRGNSHSMGDSNKAAFMSYPSHLDPTGLVGLDVVRQN